MSGTAINVPWPDAVRFVRQLNHDVRNHLNALELQAAFLNEIAPDGEVKDEIKRLRETLSSVATALQKLSTRISDPKLNRIPYPAAHLMTDLQKKFESTHPDRKARVKWTAQASDAKIDVDPQLFQEALTELLENAFRLSPAESEFVIDARTQDAQCAITLREPKEKFEAATEAWGRQPLSHISHGHYGLGLTRVRSIVEAHGGKFSATYDPSARVLVTTILLPLAAPGT
jgi:K+-sensing histidine kinase KdpD